MNKLNLGQLLQQQPSLHGACRGRSSAWAFDALNREGNGKQDVLQVIRGYPVEAIMIKQRAVRAWFMGLAFWGRECNGMLS